ncbi:MAG: sigma-70 family RNA polymerase sigma factor [Planctomycetes bacterium]|nr:sigma-70 family RNA polymerase sigma factor [Planctomycetota bacterium]
MLRARRIPLADSRDAHPWASRLAAEHSWLRRRAHRLIGRGLRRSADSTDLAHATLAKALEKPPSRTPTNRPELRAWLDRVLSRLAARLGGKPGPEAVASSALERLPRTADGVSERRREISEELLRSLDALTPRQRLVIQLRLWEKLSFAQVAVRLGTSEGNARVLFHRAIEALQRLEGRNGR